MKNPETIIKEYVSSLNEEDLRFLFSRLSERMSGDLGEAINHMDKCNDIAKWFHTAKNSDEFYSMIDKISKVIEKEHNKRFELI